MYAPLFTKLTVACKLYVEVATEFYPESIKKPERDGLKFFYALK
jgi:hypothetical protein